MPLVSVIITCHNYGRFLGEAIRSAQLQTLNDVDIVVVDDGSTDDTAQVANDLSVPLIRQEHRGPAAARNHGIAATDSRYVALLDADDTWQQNKLELQVVAMKAKGLALCHVDGVFLRGDGSEERRRRNQFPPERGCPLAHLLPDRRIYASSVLLDRALLHRAGVFDEALSRFDDMDLWFRLVVYGDFKFLRDRLFKHRMHGGNLARRWPSEGKLPVLREHVLNRWEIIAGRFEPGARAKYRRLLRREIAFCLSSEGRRLAPDHGWAKAVSAHAKALATYPWSPRLYTRLLAAVVTGR
jgi:glycosyltransferase involved in cell wall biosynthesis